MNNDYFGSPVNGHDGEAEYDFYHWSAILRQYMPRSLHASLNEVMSHLELVSAQGASDTLRHAGKLRAELACAGAA